MNPFKAAVHNGTQTYYGTAEDRIHCASRFSRAECAAALQLPGLQKTVAAAVRRRLRHLDKVTAILHFTDHGQDFLRWELDARGVVIGCEPFQASVWVGNRVLQHQALRAGDIVHFVSKRDSASLNIRYPLERVENKGSVTRSATKWAAVCPQCGEVEITQKTKPKSCKTSIDVGACSTRRCGQPLEQQREVA